MNQKKLRYVNTFIRSTLLIFFISCNAISIFAQELTFQTNNPLEIKREKEDKKYAIEFSLEKATKPCTINYKMDEDKINLESDYSLGDGSVSLNSDNSYRGKIEIIVKGNKLKKKTLTIHFTYANEKGGTGTEKFFIIISPINNGSAEEDNLTDKETNALDHLGFELYTGGTLDFFNNLKFQNIGGEIVIKANDIVGPETRLGGFIGISNFQNFSRDSSNVNGRTIRVQLDTGKYVAGKTRYSQTRYIDYKTLHTNQWSYYFNPTYRLNNTRSDFFNIYLSFRMEALIVSSTRSYKTDTLGTDTSTLALKNPIFQSGKGYLLQNLSDVQTSGYFSLGLPMFLNAKDKFKLYFDPNLGFANYRMSYDTFNDKEGRLERALLSSRKAFYLVRMRVSEQFSGLQVTIGGEIRGFITGFAPSINAYLGIRANIGGLLGKNSK